MVYCTKCGTKNSPTEKYCAKCGSPLEQSDKSWEQKIEEGAEELGKQAQKWGEDFGEHAEEWGKNFEKHIEDGCFGLSQIGALLGVLIGIIIVIAGLLLLFGVNLFRLLGSIMILAFGLIILLSALKNLTKKHQQ